ncbi:uncharacterized protein LOC128404373 isoform X2 [Podarcis raffonei]|uniref:uncharacterized protein LOC128404373 isoform X2 n=1 Tax=Podarcis raffonei TaxID=65483 RepID=UPI0023299A05|nr:uncharacterized protein LOC128404373 isoform X2 [Podarcis raffonei]
MQLKTVYLRPQNSYHNSDQQVKACCVLKASPSPFLREALSFVLPPCQGEPSDFHLPPSTSPSLPCRCDWGVLLPLCLDATLSLQVETELALWKRPLHLAGQQTLHSSLELAEPPVASNRKLVILMVGAVSALGISIVGVLLATYLGRADCVQRDAFSFLPPQVNVQNEASLLLALSELGEQGVAPGITCDLRNHLMVYHGQPEGCVARKMEVSEPLPSCQELEAYFQAVLKNATLGITSEVQIVGTASLGSLTTLLCSNKPTYLVNSFAPSPRHSMSRLA